MDEPESCAACFGEGGYHDCGDDTCCCAESELLTVMCEEGGGTGLVGGGDELDDHPEYIVHREPDDMDSGKADLEARGER